MQEPRWTIEERQRKLVQNYRTWRVTQYLAGAVCILLVMTALWAIAIACGLV